MDGLRPGKITGSKEKIGSVMAWHDTPLKNGNPKWGDPALRLAIEFADIELGGKPTPSGYSNQHMERGHEEEPIARQEYEGEYFVDVTNGGFFDNGKTGCSPDGLVDENGIIEIKCVIKSVHFECIKRNSYDPKYKWQLIHNLKESGREWIDFVSYCSTYHKKLFIHRIYAEEVQAEFKMIESRLKAFFELVEDTKQIMLETQENA
jgi:hypothetical protein